MRFPSLLIGLGLGLGLGGVRASSQIVIGVLTNLSVKGQLDEVSLIATRNGGVAVLSEDWDISDEESVNFVLPGSFTVYSPEGGTPVIEIIVTGLQSSQVKVTRTADVELLSQDQLFYRMALVDSCGANGPGTSTCPDGQSCVEGLCRSTQVNNRSLRPFAKDRVAEVECDSGIDYIDTGTCSSGSCQVIEPTARDCPGTQWCGEGTCYNRDPRLASRARVRRELQCFLGRRLHAERQRLRRAGHRQRDRRGELPPTLHQRQRLHPGAPRRRGRLRRHAHHRQLRHHGGRLHLRLQRVQRRLGLRARRTLRHRVPDPKHSRRRLRRRDLRARRRAGTKCRARRAPLRVPARSARPASARSVARSVSPAATTAPA